VATRNGSEPDYLRGLRRLSIGLVTLLLVALFLVWRIDNERVERVRVALIKPIAATARMISDMRAYQRVYEQNAELRRELQRMQSWREAALQLEQKNARLLALNNVRLNPRLTYVTGEILADAGSPFRRSAMVNVGANDGVGDGSAVVDGLGLVGRIAGVGARSSRIIFLTDASSRVPVVILPSGRRAMVSGDNGPAPLLDFLDKTESLRAGERVVSSGDGGLYPPDILVGRVVIGPDARPRVRLSADFRRLDFVRVIRRSPPALIEGPGDLIGPLLTAQPGDLAPPQGETR
jgi:rod shape-determining protein MreC